VADVAVVGNEADLFDVVSQAGSRLREKLGVEAVSPVEAVSVRASLPANREATRLYSEDLLGCAYLTPSQREIYCSGHRRRSEVCSGPLRSGRSLARMGYDKKAQQEARQAYDMSANLSREEKLLVEGRYREIGHEYDKAIEIDRTLYVLFPTISTTGLSWQRCRRSGVRRTMPWPQSSPCASFRLPLLTIRASICRRQQHGMC